MGLGLGECGFLSVEDSSEVQPGTWDVGNRQRHAKVARGWPAPLEAWNPDIIWRVFGGVHGNGLFISGSQLPAKNATNRWHP
jgi:hypothetical protein